MKILVFTEGTILMHREATGLTREEIVRQIQQRRVNVLDHASYIPLGRAVQKLQAWKRQGAEIAYLTSRRTPGEIQAIQQVLTKHAFPPGELFFRRAGEQYKDVAERVMPDILVEDDCESIGGEKEMTYPHIRPELRTRIKSITVSEFGGIDHLPNDLFKLEEYGAGIVQA